MIARCYLEGMRSSMASLRSTLLVLALALGGGCSMHHVDPPTSPDGGAHARTDGAADAHTPTPRDDAGTEAIDAAPPSAPFGACVAASSARVSSEPSGHFGLERVDLDYPRHSPDYELGLFVETFDVGRSLGLEDLLTNGGMFEVPAWGGGDFLVIGREDADSPYLLLSRADALARCPGFPSEG